MRLPRAPISSRGSWELESLADSLATRVRRPVLINDPRLRVLAYSAHPDDADRVRVDSILLREAPPGVARWLEQWGLSLARDHVAVPGDPDLGMLPRLCFPIRAEGLLLGYLWLAATADELDDDQLQDLVVTAEQAGGILGTARRIDDADRAEQGACLRDLLAGSPGAAQALVDAGFGPAEGFVVLVLAPRHDAEHPASNEVLARLAGALSAARRRVSFHAAVYTPFRGAIVAIVSTRFLGRDELDALVDGVGERSSAALSDRPGWTATAGMSAPFASLNDTVTAYEGALLAACVAASVGTFGSVARADASEPTACSPACSARRRPPRRCRRFSGICSRIETAER